VRTGFWWEQLRERDDLEDSGLNGRIILRWIFKKGHAGYGLVQSGLRQGQVTGTCECGKNFQVSHSAKYFLIS